ncbi:Plant protein of unknown function (DUF863 [Striga hermonthica]|uniref:Uncharacterized protein n=1 Tax=Striga hermonthica TaxID=68872 RepID=A0A9N7NBV0_STRHE|nr:Plant protein of unknown function (DUF863 [Striga hermonthica]
MGTKVHCKSYVPGYYYSMRDLNEDCSSSSWPSCYGDKAMTNGQYHNGFMQRTITDSYLGYDKDTLKQKIIEHEAVFRSQVYELHRLYQVQRDMMQEFQRKEQLKFRVSTEPSSSSSRRESQVQYQDPHKWHIASFPLLNSSHKMMSHSRMEIEHSPMSCTKGYNTTQPSHSPFRNVSSPEESERPLKLRKKLFDLQLPADEYIDPEEKGEVSDMSCQGEITNLSLGDCGGVKTDLHGNKLANLNEPFEVEESVGQSTVDFLDPGGKTRGESRPDKSDVCYFDENEETRRVCHEFSVRSSAASKVNESAWFAHPYEAG